ncbi:MAG: type II secretion system F family protein, partial [Burkholderiales bacterium]
MNAPTSGKAAAPALADFILLNQEIAALVRARLPLESHLSQIGAELPGKAGELADRIGKRLATGESFSSAFEAECGSMPAVYRATIEAGVESGHLGTAIESLVDTASRMDQLRRVTGLAIMYPIVLIMTASMLFALVLTKVVPQFGWLNDSPVASITWMSHWPAAVFWSAVGVPSLVVLLALVWWWRSGKIAQAAGTRFIWMAWLPGTRAVHHWSQAATFSELLLLMIERGVPFGRALRLTADAIDDVRLRTA